MRIVWDEIKRHENLAKHGMDFAELDITFFVGAVVAPSRENRFVAVGVFGSETAISVVFRTMGEEAISLISMRPASRKGKEASDMKGKLRTLTEEEEARIQFGIAADPDNPELTDEQLANAKPFAEAFPELAKSISRLRGRPRVAAPKQAVTLRLSPEVIARFKAAGGRQWRARMSEALEKAGG